ncbi:Tn3 family transposase [Nonomuraea sp. NPDC049028]|uniref:Tn3 family transposase n=1 Tax=Nonomuraea sp. NPDC049028 TaxID=3364348 RepID=UPI00372166AD
MFLLRGRGDDRGPAAHRTNAEIEANHTDTHGATTVGFAFTELLGCKLLPRMKNIGAIELYRPEAAPAAWPKMDKIPKKRPIDWDPSPAMMTR